MARWPHSEDHLRAIYAGGRGNTTARLYAHFWADGRVTIRHGRSRARHLVEVPIEQRAPILQRYLQKVPGARPHIPVNRNAPPAEFEAIAARYPVYRVETVTTPAHTPKESGK